MEDFSKATAGIIAPPPILYLASLFSGLSFNFASPAPIASYIMAASIGALLFLLSASFARWSFLTMRRHDTSANPRAQSAALVTSGPFAISRNPIYVAMTGLYLGIALLVNSWWPVTILPVLLGVMHWGVIVREERYLAAQFGEVYLRYKEKVRRWL